VEVQKQFAVNVTCQMLPNGIDDGELYSKISAGAVFCLDCDLPYKLELCRVVPSCAKVVPGLYTVHLHTFERKIELCQLCHGIRTYRKNTLMKSVSILAPGQNRWHNWHNWHNFILSRSRGRPVRKSRGAVTRVWVASRTEVGAPRTMKMS
jgi:hypothetical protein